MMMANLFNPYVLFTPRLAEAFVDNKEPYLVLQSSGRLRQAFDDTAIQYLLATQYHDAGHAKEHFDALKLDDARQYYDLTEREDHQRFLLLLQQHSVCKIFANLTYPGWEGRADRVLYKKFRALINNETDWHPPRWDEVITRYESKFGCLHVLIRYRSHTVRYQLDYIENRY